MKIKKLIFYGFIGLVVFYYMAHDQDRLDNTVDHCNKLRIGDRELSDKDIIRTESLMYEKVDRYKMEYRKAKRLHKEGEMTDRDLRIYRGQYDKSNSIWLEAYRCKKQRGLK